MQAICHSRNSMAPEIGMCFETVTVKRETVRIRPFPFKAVTYEATVGIEGQDLFCGYHCNPQDAIRAIGDEIERRVIASRDRRKGK